MLDVKRQGAPAGAPYLAAAEQDLLDAAVANQAERTIAGYRALSSDADDHLRSTSARTVTTARSGRWCARSPAATSRR